MMRDYLAESSSNVDGDTTAMYIDCTVEKVFISEAPPGSPFRMTENDREEIFQSLVHGKEAERRRFANHLYSNAEKDRFFDVLVCLREVDSKKIHFQAVQCKARSRFGASIDISSYVGRLFVAKTLATKVKSLIRFELFSNVYYIRQLDPGHGDFIALKETGEVQSFLFSDIRAEKANLFSAAQMARKPFSEEITVPSPHRPNYREFQQRALETLATKRQEGYRGGTVVVASGSGKSITAYEDSLRALHEQGDKQPLLWTNRTILLLTQAAIGFIDWERYDILHNSREGSSAKRYYYLVCSAEKVYSPSLRVIKNSHVFSTLLMHHAKGDLNLCRFFSTVEGSAGFWMQVVDYVKVTRGASASITEPFFGVYIRDEVHQQCGPSNGTYALGLNIPAMWYVSYTATPLLEQRRRQTLQAFAFEEDDDEDEEEEDGGTKKKQRSLFGCNCFGASAAVE